MRSIRGLAALLLSLAIAACGPSTGAGATRSGAPSPMDRPSPTATPNAPSSATSPATMAAARWATEILTDVRTGQTFTLADLAGSVVLLEGMATWCPPCLDQQQQAQLALTRLDPAKVRYISLDVDPREAAATLARYADRHGFDWTFAVAEPALLRELAEAFGDPVLTPPVTPVLVVAPDGTATLADLGIKDANQLIELAGSAGA